MEGKVLIRLEKYHLEIKQGQKVFRLILDGIPNST